MQSTKYLAQKRAQKMLVLFVLTFSNMLENKGEKLVSGKQNGPEEHNGIILLRQA